jgi:membrane dipeptidase
MAEAAWFDAHLDLAMLAVLGRDMMARPEAIAPDKGGGGWGGTAGLTRVSLAAGNVRMCLGTIFTAPGDTGPEGYPVGDAERAFVVGRAQLEVYLTWRDRGLIALDRLACVRAGAGLGEVRGGMGVAEMSPLSTRKRMAMVPAKPAIHLGILIENADPVRSPAELGWWKERGVVAVGMAWAKSSRYAGGNTTTDGLTPLGREFVGEMDRLGLVHDASHLSDRAFDELCAATDRRVFASHSNCRAITDPTGANQRHLTDAQIEEIVRRGGVIVINLYSAFLREGLKEKGRASVEDVVKHVERVCDLAGSRGHVGMGSDMDGGFSADRMPEGIDSPRGYGLVAEALRGRGWSEEEVMGFAAGNWMRMLEGLSA